MCMSPTHSACALFSVYLKFKFNFLYFHLLNLRNLGMWLMDSGLWLTGLWAWVFNPFYFIPSSDFCVSPIPTLSFSQSRALSFISPEDKLLAFSRDRREGVLATLVENFVGSECPENWLSSNFLILSCEHHIHFSWCFLSLSPRRGSARPTAHFSVVQLSAPLCQNTWPSSAGLHLPQTYWHLFSTVGVLSLSPCRFAFAFKFIWCHLSGVSEGRKHRRLGSVHQV